MTTVRQVAAGTRLKSANSRIVVRPFNIELLLCGVVLVVFIAMATLPSLFTSYDPIHANPVDRLLPPSTTHPFGTDSTGRDLFARTVYGAELSLRSALVAVTISAGVGSFLGLLAGFLRGWLDTVVSRFADSILAMPGLLFALALIASLGNGSMVAAVAIGIAGFPTFTRVMRAEAMRVSTQTYVEAATAGGGRRPAILFTHVLPNAVGPVGGLAVLEFGQAMLLIGALSYLGFGEPPPTPEWGSLIAAGQPLLATAWWLSILPGLVLAVVVLSVNRTAHILQNRN